MGSHSNARTKTCAQLTAPSSTVTSSAASISSTSTISTSTSAIRAYSTIAPVVDRSTNIKDQTMFALSPNVFCQSYSSHDNLPCSLTTNLKVYQCQCVP